MHLVLLFWARGDGPKGGIILSHSSHTNTYRTMNVRFRDLIEQTYDFPTEEFSLDQAELLFHGLNLSELVAQYGSPLKFTYLPKISENIGRAKNWFASAMQKYDYKGKYFYCYCTKSSH